MGNRIRFDKACGGAVAAFWLAVSTAWSQGFLVKDGKPCAEIVIAEKPARMTKLAAAELQNYVEKISGAKLSVVTAPTQGCPARIFVGQSAHTKVTAEGLTDGAFRMVSGPDWLALVGTDTDFTPREPYAKSAADRPRVQKEWDALTGSRWGSTTFSVFKGYNAALGVWSQDERGSLNAVHEFLRSLGVRWYMPGDFGEITPKLKTIALPQVNKTVRPDFAIRDMSFYGKPFVFASPEEVMWQMRLGLSSKEGLGGHGIHYVINHPNTKTAHPEYYLLAGGKRDTETRGAGRPCLSSPGLMKSNVEFAQAVFKIYDSDCVSVMPTDGYVSICQCDLCKGKDTPDRGFEGRLSDYVWAYVNGVAKEVYKTNPDKKISCYAYTSYLLPPEKIEKLSPNIIVGICQWRSGFYNTETRDMYRKLRKDWLAKMPSPGIFIWEYYLHGRPGRAYEGLPAVFPRLIADDLRSLKGICRGEGIEVYRTMSKAVDPDPALATNHLNCYVTARLWWDVTQDLDAMLDEYYRLFYGPAAGQMKAFIEYAETNWMKAMKDAAIIDKLSDLLSSAQKAAGDTIYGKRINLIAEYTKPLKQKRDQLAKGRDDAPKARAYPRYGVTPKMDGKLDDPFWQGMAVYGLSDLITGKKVKNPTTFRIALANNSVYFGIECMDSDMKGINIGAKDNEDMNLWNGDAIEILLETQTHCYYQIAIGPSGAIVDADRKERIDTRWSSQAKVAVSRGDKSWTLEVEIPVAGDTQEEVDALNGVSGRLPSGAHPWYFNVCRQRIRENDREFSAFSPTGKTAFHDVMKFGQIYVR